MITITILETQHTFDYIRADDDTTIVGAVDIYVKSGFDIGATKKLITSNGNFYVDDDAIEDFNISSGELDCGTGDVVIHHTEDGADEYELILNGVIQCKDFWIRKATDGAVLGCEITLGGPLLPIIVNGGRIIVENRMPTLPFKLIQNGQLIGQGML